MIRVGDRYPGASWPMPEGVASHAAQAWTLTIVVADPSQRERDAITVGAIDVSIDRDGPAIVWLVRAPDCIGWSACASAWWERTAPETPTDHPGVGGVAQIVLVDAASARIRAMRTIGLTTAVAARLRELETEAQASGRDDASLERARAWTRTASPEQIAERASTAPVVTGVPARRS